MGSEAHLYMYNKVSLVDQKSSKCMQEYKSLCLVVAICATAIKTLHNR